MTQTISQQEELALKTAMERSTPYVCLLCTKGQDWSWYVANAYYLPSNAIAWFDSQKGIARVYRVHKLRKPLIYCAK